jgi:hypothetical protein
MFPSLTRIGIHDLSAHLTIYNQNNNNNRGLEEKETNPHLMDTQDIFVICYLVRFYNLFTNHFINRCD